MVRQDDGGNFFRRAGNEGGACPVVRFRDGDYASMRRQAHPEKVMHSRQALRKTQVQLGNDHVGIVHRRVSAAAGGGGVKPPAL